MVNIVLFCGAGMSTSLLAARMKEAADGYGIETTVEAYPLSQLSIVGPTADIVLLGPQIRHNKNKVVEALPNTPVEVIDMTAYGMVDGKKVIDDVLKVLNIQAK